MTFNVGLIDRGLRMVAGLALIAAALGLYGPAYQSIWGWIGVVPVVTALIGWCPLYTVLGIKTCNTASTH
jgi:hypothetical protein